MFNLSPYSAHYLAYLQAEHLKAEEECPARAQEIVDAIYNPRVPNEDARCCLLAAFIGLLVSDLRGGRSVYALPVSSDVSDALVLAMHEKIGFNPDAEFDPFDHPKGERLVLIVKGSCPKTAAFEVDGHFLQCGSKELCKIAEAQAIFMPSNF